MHQRLGPSARELIERIKRCLEAGGVGCIHRVLNEVDSLELVAKSVDVCSAGWALVEGRRGRAFVVIKDGAVYVVDAWSMQRVHSLDEAIVRVFNSVEPVRIVVELGSSVTISRRVEDMEQGKALAKVLLFVATCLRDL